jgi:hypothetical protein
VSVIALKPQCDASSVTRPLRAFLAILALAMFTSISAYSQTSDISGHVLVPCSESQERAAQCGVAEQCLVWDSNAHPKGSFENAFGDFGSCRTKVADGLVASGCPSRAKTKNCSLELNGPISKAQVDSLEKYLSSHNATRVWIIEVSSPGGDIDAAMRLGSIIRAQNASVSVSGNNLCASACVLVLAAGVMRSVWGEVAIHRPYRAEGQALGMEQAQRGYEARNARIAAYLRRMNVPASLLDAMLAVPSHEARVLSRDELHVFGLSGIDPVYEEETDARRAKRLGVSMPEYLSLKAAYEDCRARYRWSPESVATCGRQFPGVW